MAARVRHILLTGLPGVGKTTLVRRICEELQKIKSDLTISGFYTSEIRCPKSGTRIGFELITIPDNDRTCLATVDAATASVSKRTANVGKYTVLLDSFEPLILKCLTKSQTSKLLVVDEIGKMECFSKPFCDEIEQIFDRDCFVLGTIPMEAKSGNVSRLVDKIKQRHDVKIVLVTRENREKLVAELLQMIKTMAFPENKQT